MRLFALPLATLVVLIACGSSGYAQQAQSPAPDNRTLSSQPSGTIRLTHLIGARVDAADGAPAGVVNDVLIDKTGAIRSVVIAIAGARGLGDKNIAVRRDRLDLASDKESPDALSPSAIAQAHAMTFRTDLTQHDLEGAPDFAPEQRATTAGTPESTQEPKSSTQSGGPG